MISEFLKFITARVEGNAYHLVEQGIDTFRRHHPHVFTLTTNHAGRVIARNRYGVDCTDSCNNSDFVRFLGFLAEHPQGFVFPKIDLSKYWWVEWVKVSGTIEKFEVEDNQPDDKFWCGSFNLERGCREELAIVLNCADENETFASTPEGDGYFQLVDGVLRGIFRIKSQSRI